MAPHASPKTTTTSPPEIGDKTFLMRMWRKQASPAAPARWAYRSLLAAALLLDLAAIGLGGYLLVYTNTTIAPPADRRMTIAYSGSPVLETLRGWIVQDNGRNKPFDTFSRETVRTITGKERFEDNDAVAVVASWLWSKGDEADEADWEHYPFILCDHPELRQELYRELRGPTAQMTQEDLHGRFVEPMVLRQSGTLKRLARDASGRTDRDGKTRSTILETKALEIRERLALYDGVRGSSQGDKHRGEFGVVALDKYGSAWFSLRAVSDFAEKPELWSPTMRRRRMGEPRRFEGTAPQPVPFTEIKEVAAAAALLQAAYLSGDDTRMAVAFGDFLGIVQRATESFNAYPGDANARLELWFNRTNPFRLAWLSASVASLFLATSVFLLKGRAANWLYGLGMFGCVWSLSWAMVGFWCRIALSGRPPVGNMYESLIWVAFVTAAMGLVAELIYRNGHIGLAAMLASTLGFVLAEQMPLTFQPLPAVLRSNFWLVVHVLTIVSSFAAFALAWAIGSVQLGVQIARPERRDLAQAMSGFAYRAIQLGVLLLGAGTFFGGCWAAESWGRFWNWDPKEVWVLLVLLAYATALYARHVGWVGDFGMAVAAVVSFASVVMAWYGVNHILGAGLHLYGLGGGNAWWVCWGGLLNIAVVVHVGLKHWGQRVEVVRFPAG